jgi:translation initiation factor IF-1
MVRNTQGGSGHKKFARKNAAGPTQTTRVRFSNDACELYAIVTRMLGNGMFGCVALDGVERIGHIRGKFAGKRKSQNILSVTRWVLVGLREWDLSKSSVGSTKLQQCDLLEIYADTDKMVLKDALPHLPWANLENNDKTISLMNASATSDDVVFCDKGDDDEESESESEKKKKKYVVKEKEKERTCVVVDIDDI